MTEEENPTKPVIWIGSSKEDLTAFPDEVKYVMGHALHAAQLGGKHPDAKALKHFGSAGILEFVESFDREAYRVVYTVKFEGIVLHAFQKKSKRGSDTPQKDMNLIASRLKTAEKIHQEAQKASGKRVSARRTTHW